MKEKYTNLNTKINDTEVKAIQSQFKAIDEQINILIQSKVSLYRVYWISKANYYLRLKNLGDSET